MRNRLGGFSLLRNLEMSELKFFGFCATGFLPFNVSDCKQTTASSQKLDDDDDDDDVSADDVGDDPCCCLFVTESFEKPQNELI